MPDELSDASFWETETARGTGKKALDVATLCCDGVPMSWDVPDRYWRFPIDDDPTADLPGAWVTATRAVTRDLHCRRHGRNITFTNVMWHFVVSGEWVALGFEAPADADLGSYQRCTNFRLDTSPAQASVWLADAVQEKLTGNEFVQWPATGQRILYPRIIEGHAVWVDPATNDVIAPIGELCTAP